MSESLCVRVCVREGGRERERIYFILQYCLSYYLCVYDGGGGVRVRMQGKVGRGREGMQVLKSMDGREGI